MKKVNKLNNLPKLTEIFYSIYASWHGCALKESERGIPIGSLCDVCSEMVKDHVSRVQNLKVNELN